VFSTAGSPHMGPEETFSPLRKYENLTCTSPAGKVGKEYLKEPKDSFELVTRHPILNGYTNTVENLGSKNFELTGALLKKNFEQEIQSPQLKKSLQENRDIKTFQLKLSSFCIKDNKEEKKTNEKKMEDQVMENLKGYK